MTEILEPEEAAWDAPGDEVRFAYRLLGRRVEGKTILDSTGTRRRSSSTPTSPDFQWCTSSITTKRENVRSNRTY
jgi:hypothetical protein